MATIFGSLSGYVFDSVQTLNAGSSLSVPSGSYYVLIYGTTPGAGQVNINFVAAAGGGSVTNPGPVGTVGTVFKFVSVPSINAL